MQDSFDLRALRDIGLSHATVQAALARTTPRGRAAGARRRDPARPPGGARRRRRARRRPLARAARRRSSSERDQLVVGDWVWWRAAASDVDRGWVVARLPARNRLTRRDPAGGRQGLVANIDTALVVMGLDHDFNLRRLDRFLVLAHSADARVVVVLTKADACADAGAAHRARARRTWATRATTSPSWPSTAARPRRRRRSRRGWCAARTLVTLGSSGAGKTTLTNTLTGAGVDHARGARARRARPAHDHRAHAAPHRRRRLPDRHAGPAPAVARRRRRHAATTRSPRSARWRCDAATATAATRRSRAARCASRCRAARLVSFQKLLREANREQRRHLPAAAAGGGDEAAHAGQPGAQRARGSGPRRGDRTPTPDDGVAALRGAVGSRNRRGGLASARRHAIAAGCGRSAATAWPARSERRMPDDLRRRETPLRPLADRGSTACGTSASRRAEVAACLGSARERRRRESRVDERRYRPLVSRRGAAGRF